MDKRDREILSGLARVNTEIGEVTLQLLTVQSSDEYYAAALRKFGRELVHLGASLAVRAAELDGRTFDPADLFTVDEPPSELPHAPSR